MLNKQFPVITGLYQLTKEWFLTLPGKYNKRLEKGEMVIWNQGFTMWIAVYNNDKKLSPQKQIEWIKEEKSPESYGVKEIDEGNIYRYGYKLEEIEEEKKVNSFNAFVSSKIGYVCIAFYYDRKDDYKKAEKIWKSISLQT